MRLRPQSIATEIFADLLLALGVFVLVWSLQAVVTGEPLL